MTHEKEEIAQVLASLIAKRKTANCIYATEEAWKKIKRILLCIPGTTMTGAYEITFKSGSKVWGVCKHNAMLANPADFILDVDDDTEEHMQ